MEKKKENIFRDMAKSFKVAFADKNTRFLILGIIANMLALYGRQGITAYYFIYVLDNPMAMSTAMPAMLLGMFLTNFYTPFVLKKINKKTAGVLAAIANALSLVGLFWVGQIGSSTGAIIFSFLNGVTNMSYVVQFSLAGDIIDDNWIRTGKRTEGITYSVISFATKLGNAVGGSIGILVLSAVGYVANTQMSARVLTKVNGVINLAPIVFLILTAIFYGKVDMDNKKAMDNKIKVQEMLENTGE